MEKSGNILEFQSPLCAGITLKQYGAAIKKVEVLEKLCKEVHKFEIPQQEINHKIIALINSITVEEDNEIIYSCAKHLSQIINKKNKFQLSETERKQLLCWFQAIFNSHIPLDVNLITTITTMLEVYDYCDSKTVWKNMVLDNNVLNRIDVSNKKNTGRNELLLSVVQCYDAILDGILKNELESNYRDLEANKDIAKILLDIYYNSCNICNDSSYAGLFALHVLRILTKLCKLSSATAHMFVAEIFGLSRFFFFYGLNESVKSVDVPQKILPSQQAVAFDATEEAAAEAAAKSEQAKNSGGRLTKTRKLKIVQRDTRPSKMGQESETEIMQLLKQEFSQLKTSDSELDIENSDNEHFCYQKRERLCSKVRFTAIGLLEIVALSQTRRQIYGYWHAFFPTFLSNDAGLTKRNDLLFVAERDPNERCRCFALQVSSKLIYGSKAFLAQAELISPRTSNFQTFVHHLGTMLLATYNSLTCILAKEASNAVLTQALKTLAVLVQATSFTGLKNVNIVSNFVEYVRPLVYERDSTVKIAALMVMEFLLAVPELSPEIAEVLGLHNTVHTSDCDDEEEIDYNEIVQQNLTSKSTVAVRKKKLEKNNNTSWLLLNIMDNINQILLENHQYIVSYEPALSYKINPLLIQSLQVLNAMANHFTLLLPEVERLAELFITLITRKSSTETLYHATRCLSSCVHHMNLWLALMQQQKTDSIENITTKCFSFWERVLPVIVNYLEEACGKTEADICQVCENLMDAISNMGAIIYEHFPHASQIKLLSFLSYIGNDMSTTGESRIYEGILHSSAVRALSIFATFPTLCSDLVFIENTVELALRVVNDKNVLARTKIVWSIGNLSDVLVMKCTLNNNSNLNESTSISDDLLHSLLITAIKGCHDNHKVRCNAVRILGNLLRLLSINKLKTEIWNTLFLEATNSLKNACMNNLNNAKTRWNACYSIGMLFRNQAIFDSSIMQWHPNIYDTLCQVIVEDKNFKVRINAANAIQQIAQRLHYLTYFEKFWYSILIAIERSYNLENFYEYNHRDKLQEELCIAICHLVRLAEPEDFVIMGKNLSERLEPIQNTWVRVTHRLVPEKAALLMACSIVILQKVSLNLTPVQNSALKFVAQILSLTT